MEQQLDRCQIVPCPTSEQHIAIVKIFVSYLNNGSDNLETEKNNADSDDDDDDDDDIKLGLDTNA